MGVRRAATGLAVGVAAVLCVAGIAWACTPQPRILGLTHQFGHSQSTFTVRGDAVAPAGVVEMRWNAVHGPVVGTGVADENGDFAADVRVPDVAPGVYSLLAVADGTSLARVAFEVVPKTAPSADAAPTSVTPPWGSVTSAPLHSSPASSNTVSVGAGLLAVGLVALFSGFTVATVRRRKALAGPPR